MKGRISSIPFLTTCTERIHESDSHCVLNDFLAAFPHQSATFRFCCYRTRCARLLLCIYYSLSRQYISRGKYIPKRYIYILYTERVLCAWKYIRFRARSRLLSLFRSFQTSHTSIVGIYCKDASVGECMLCVYRLQHVALAFQQHIACICWLLLLLLLFVRSPPFQQAPKHCIFFLALSHSTYYTVCKRIYIYASDIMVRNLRAFRVRMPFNLHNNVSLTLYWLSAKYAYIQNTHTQTHQVNVMCMKKILEQFTARRQKRLLGATGTWHNVMSMQEKNPSEKIYIYRILFFSPKTLLCTYRKLMCFHFGFEWCV